MSLVLFIIFYKTKIKLKKKNRQKSLIIKKYKILYNSIFNIFNINLKKKNSDYHFF